MVFPNVYDRYRNNVNEDTVVFIKGKLNFKEGESPKLLADLIINVDEIDRAGQVSGEDGVGKATGKANDGVTGNSRQRLKVRIPQDMDEGQILRVLERVFLENPGDIQPLIYLQSGKIVRSSVNVDMTGYLKEELNEIVGASNIKLDR